VSKEPCTICGESDECTCYIECIHDKCGLDIELCVCPDTPFYWDNELGIIKERIKKENK